MLELGTAQAQDLEAVFLDTAQAQDLVAELRDTILVRDTAQRGRASLVDQVPVRVDRTSTLVDPASARDEAAIATLDLVSAPADRLVALAAAEARVVHRTLAVVHLTPAAARPIEPAEVKP